MAFASTKEAEIAARRLRDAARVVPHGLNVGNSVTRIRKSEDGVRRAKLGVGKVRRCLHGLHQRDAARNLVGNEAAQFLGC